MTLGSQGEAKPNLPGPRKPTIVVVDDCEVTLASTAETLERAGYRVITRNRSAGCVALMLQEKPDLVLLDVCMPTVAGDTLVKLFSRASPNSGTIILLYSALDEALLESKANASGAHGYVMKTNDGAALLRAIRRYLRPSQTNVPAFAPIAKSSPEKDAFARTASSHSSAARLRVEPPSASRLRGLDVRTSVSGEIRRTSGAYQIEAARVLFVDDDMLALSAYRRQLFGQPFEFDFALSGAQAVRLLTSATPPSVIVSDLLMPDLSGREVLRRALDHNPSWNRRFIVVTALSTHEARSLLDLRFTGTLLRKPVDTDALSGAIRACLMGMGISAPLPSELGIR
ncbi:MAG: response regulator [Deltaproteobacteria bacterium]